jgi:hypothetical protein
MLGTYFSLLVVLKCKYIEYNNFVEGEKVQRAVELDHIPSGCPVIGL